MVSPGDEQEKIINENIRIIIIVTVLKEDILGNIHHPLPNGVVMDALALAHLDEASILAVLNARSVAITLPQGHAPSSYISKKTNAVTSQWGKYGVINESDIYSKEEEFKTWLVEECKVNPEILSKDQTKKHFARYMEDYNTATLPHEKFYNMKRYESRMDLLRNGEFVPQGDEDTYDFNADYRAHSSALKRGTTESESYLTKEQLQELRQVQRERVELIKRKQLGLEVSGTLGVRMDGGSVEE
ncbi:hypothetical protein Clacol_002717 [Clathrus columnatus]|uniref:Uncharacterized protein n=1 Tax=Clathrus columnatus TaxID=1419009 RepID=A0AAV5A6Y1_9AGAM|nr:hypothetical protein Clacol_002717 [Clathrus columnatus]